MVEYQRGSHTLHDIKYHLVWITKYRYHVLRGAVAERARDVIREICMAREVQIIRDLWRRITRICWWRVPRSWPRPSWCSRSKVARRGSCSKNFRSCVGVTGVSICGRAGILRDGGGGG